MDWPSLYAIGAFIQGLRQNPGLEATLQELGLQAHVYVGTGLGNIGKLYDASIELHHAQRRWDRFWSEPERNSALREHLAAHGSDPVEGVPPAPAAAAAAHADPDAREAAVHVWQRYWADRSPELAQYLAALAAIEKTSITGSVESGKVHVIRARDASRGKLQQQWGAPDAPWEVSADVVWNLHNTPAAQVSMLGNITGLAFSPVAACSTFGVALKLGMDAIRRGEAKAVVVGATDPPPHPLIVGGFFSARVLAADGRVSLPLTRLQGTHVAGGSVVWILGDYDYMTARGYRVLGMEPIAVGVSSDADHIITPTLAGPTAAIEQALAAAGAVPGDIGTWDLHATATPGDYNEVKLMQLDAAAHRARHGAQGDVRARDERRQRLGADRAVSRLRARQAVSDRAARERPQPGHRGAARQLRPRQGLRRAAGPGRQALARRRRHQRLRHLAAVAGRGDGRLTFSSRLGAPSADRCRWPVGRRPATRPRRWRSRAAPRRRRSPDRAA